MLEKNKIDCFGAGRNISEIRQPKILNQNGTKVAFLGYTTEKRHVRSIIAKENKAGCLEYNIEMIREDISKAKSISDFTVISFHWGHEYHEYPSPFQVDLAHRIIDAGANLIIGTHPHIIQGYEEYKGALIFYSLGNFFFPDFIRKDGLHYCWPEKSKYSIVVRVKISMGTIDEYEIIPVKMMHDHRLMILDGNEKQIILNRVNEISRRLQDKDYVRFWNNYHKKMTAKLFLRESFVYIKNLRNIALARP